MKLLQFGAGNIGRGFIGQIFSRAGYEVVFVDVNSELITLLNERRKYTIEVRDEPPRRLLVEGVRAIHFGDTEAVVKELCECDIASTAVGVPNLPQLYPTIALGLIKRWQGGGKPLDIIICENLRNASLHFRDGLSAHLPKDFPMDSFVGLVETSIGRMIPIMPEEVRRQDPLLLYAEAYDTLIVDGRAFKNPLPQVPQIDPKENIQAYVDRKLFIHNLGHSAVAYMAYVTDPSINYIWQALELMSVRSVAKNAMWESALSLIREYPDEFDEHNQNEHINDLLRRFSNRYLGDTVYRVGRDLIRKLGREERIIGALLLDLKHGIEPNATITVLAAALLFRATDEHGRLYPNDYEFVRKWYPRGVEAILSELCGLSMDDERQRQTIERVRKLHDEFLRRL
ncbi:MAG: mannitol-1-phosphate 5-dehydrogenase [Armatimonadota bacterium]|nr:mannitol-1-phosphate 5-dehydrogenase [Armatimonadota bacterium]MCX7778163.1 mannitol-1-phosphate 5-dehydrogenase [Armatimonadota bacterium]MDW8026183.1 mannitol-1-phosphate 5-dehydrogenase [Armatimonadota bacterium]